MAKKPTYEELEQRVSGLEEENALIKTEREELKLFFNLTPDMLCISGFDGYAKRVNLAFEKVLGFSSDEILATPFLDFVHPEDRPATVARLKDVYKGVTTLYFEQRCRCKNGSYKWLAWTVNPVVEEKQMYGAAKDITEKRQMENNFRESEERYRILMLQVRDGVYTGNGNRKMTHRGNPNLTHPLVKKSIPILLFTAERIPE